MARVNINITARDLTRGELTRMRRNFGNLGQDMDRAIGNRTRLNFQRLGQSITQARRDLTAMRGAIPEDEFFRLDTAIRRAQNRMSRGFRRTNLDQVRRDVDRVTDGFRRLGEANQIRVRIDNSALVRADARLAAWRREQARRGVRVPVRPDVDRNGFRRLGRVLTAPIRSTANVIGGVLSDGIGQGIANGFKGAAPVMGVLLLAAIAAALSVVGAALSGLLITALGAAFVGVAGVSAAMSDEVQKKWSKTLGVLKKEFKSVGEPMIPVLDRAIDKIQQMATKAAPLLKTQVQNATGATNKFIDGILKGFESFGKAAFQPIMDAWNVFAPVFGEEWNTFMDQLGKSFADMAKLVQEHPTEIAMALNIVFDALDLLVDAVTFFGKVWVATLDNAGNVIGFFIDEIAAMVEAGFLGFRKLLDVIGAVAGLIPGMSGKVKEAKAKFDELGTGAVQRLRDMAAGTRAWGDSLDRANKRRQLQADISQWTTQLALARKRLKDTTSQKAKAKVEADISALTAKLKAARAELNSLNGKTATTYVQTIFSYKGKNAALDAGAFAHGGNVGAAATGGVRSNMTLVGENGPEILNIAPGSHVRSNPDTRRMISQNVSQGQPMSVNLVVDGKVLASVLVDPLRGEIRDRGGNVQSALGVRGK